jgi:hypothetical protein
VTKRERERIVKRMDGIITDLHIIKTWLRSLKKDVQNNDFKYYYTLLGMAYKKADEIKEKTLVLRYIKA